MVEVPLVSVKMLTYNHDPYIAQAIEGVISQKTDFPFELVIGEDCSTDSTRLKVQEYQKKYPKIIKVITSDCNVGMHKNSLRTTNACSGKYIANCEGDDYWHNHNKLQIQLAFLENNPDYGMVHGNANSFDETTGNLKESYVFYNPQFDDANAFYDILIGNRSICTLTVCARKDLILNSLKNNPECTDSRYLMGDLQMWLEISRISKVLYIPESLGTYRVLPNSMSRNTDINKTLRFLLSANELMGHYLIKYNCSDEVVKMVKSNHSVSLLKTAIWANNKMVADKIMKEMIELNIDVSLNFAERLSYWGMNGRLNNYIISVLKSIKNRF